MDASPSTICLLSRQSYIQPQLVVPLGLIFLIVHMLVVLLAGASIHSMEPAHHSPVILLPGRSCWYSQHQHYK